MKKLGPWSVYEMPKQRWPFRCDSWVHASASTTDEMRAFLSVTIGHIETYFVNTDRITHPNSDRTVLSIKAGFTAERDRLVFLLRWSDIDAA